MPVHEPKPLHDVNVGAAEGCDLLIFEDQKIAAFGSSYSDQVIK